MNALSLRQPVLFLPHGGGPCFFMDWNPPETWQPLAKWLSNLIPNLPERPRAVLVVSGHWEEDAFTANTSEHPSLLYDYSGFPAHTYHLSWPVAGDPALAKKALALLSTAGLPVAENNTRGLDHGVFVPFKLIDAQAEIPTVQLSLHASLDPDLHLAAGRALAPLRDEGVLIVASGMSWHNMRSFGRDETLPVSRQFDQWLTAAVAAEPGERNRLLAGWEQSPLGRVAHPREEHLIPLLVAAGAAEGDRGRQVFQDAPMQAVISAYRFGE